MSILYQVAIIIYKNLIGIYARFNHKAKLWVEGRKNWEQNLKSVIEGKQNVYWFHAASLGEFEQARPIIEEIKQRESEVFVLLSFFSPSGYEVRKDYLYADYVCYLPADTSRNAQKWVSTISPTKVFFIKYEFWFNYMNELKKHQIDLYLISGTFHLQQLFFKPYGKWFAKQLVAFKHFFLQDKPSQAYLKQLGYENSTVTGDTRFDRVIAVSESPKSLPLIQQFVGSEVCLVVGSSWSEDETIISEYINQRKNYKLILAPHEVDEKHIQKVLNLLKGNVIRWSKVKEKTSMPFADILLIDTVGILNSVYQFADVAYVGGAFGTGLHNILEPAVYGVPVIFGNKHSKFPEAQALIDHKGGFSIQNQSELNALLDRFYSDASYRNECGKSSKSFIYQSQGATEQIIKQI